MTDAPLNYHPENPAGVLVLLHGLGAAGDDLYPLAKYLCGGQLRVVCPHAPVRPVTVNGGIPMRAWYDIAGANLEDRQDAAGIKESAAQINALLAAESARGFAANKIFLGGFSQGAAMALYAGLRYAETLAGVIALSGYLLLEETLTAESAAANMRTPIFQAHGEYDPIVLPQWARHCRNILQTQNRPLTYKEYPTPHTIPPQTTTDLSEWIEKILAE